LYPGNILFIGEKGLPLEVVGGSLSVNKFLEKSNKALETHQNSTTKNVTVTAAVSTLSQISEASSSTQQTSVSSPPQEQPAAAQELSSRETMARPGPSDEPTASIEQHMPLNDRVERAKKLIEQKRNDKEDNENQELKKKEFDRRHLGQELSKAKCDREERQAHDIVNQIKEDRAKE